MGRAGAQCRRRRDMEVTAALVDRVDRGRRLFLRPEELREGDNIPNRVGSLRPGIYPLLQYKTLMYLYRLLSTSRERHGSILI